MSLAPRPPAVSRRGVGGSDPNADDLCSQPFERKPRLTSNRTTAVVLRLRSPGARDCCAGSGRDPEPKEGPLFSGDGLALRESAGSARPEARSLPIGLVEGGRGLRGGVVRAEGVCGPINEALTRRRRRRFRDAPCPRLGWGSVSRSGAGGFEGGKPSPGGEVQDVDIRLTRPRPGGRYNP